MYQSCRRPADHSDVESSVPEDDSSESDESEEPEGATGLGDQPAPTKVVYFSILSSQFSILRVLPCLIDVNY